MSGHTINSDMKLMPFISLIFLYFSYSDWDVVENDSLEFSDFEENGECCSKNRNKLIFFGVTF